MVTGIMRNAHLSSIVKKKFRLTTNSNHKVTVFEKKLYRIFLSATIGAVWVSDIIIIK
jgi:putative transposase